MTGAEFGGVDIDLLADYIGGVLTGTPDESTVAALIADDPAWQAAFESLGGGMALVGAALGRLEPEPMPAELAARLEALFTAPGESGNVEAEAGSTAPHLTIVRGTATTAGNATTVGDATAAGAATTAGDGIRRVPGKTATRRGRRMRWATPIAVAAGLVAFVGFGLDYLAARDDAPPGSATSSAVGLSDQRAAGSTFAAQTFVSGTDYTRATLAEPPARPLTAPELSRPSSEHGLVSPKVAPEPSPAQADADPALQPLTGAGALQQCVAAIEQANAAGAISVTSVDYARFDGSPAVIVRFIATNGSWSWASGPACGSPGAGAATLDKVPVR